MLLIILTTVVDKLIVFLKSALTFQKYIFLPIYFRFIFAKFETKINLFMITIRLVNMKEKGEVIIFDDLIKNK